ncbi:MAG: xanthine dehydrogenase family protein molybdopterin-binding subunit [Anaerolineae bacterium]
MTAIGQSVERLDIRTKVLGSRKYPQDCAMEGMLHAVVVWAEHPHARIVSIEVAEALALSGVVAVFTHRDVPVNEYGINEYDQPVLAADKVRWMGDRVAVVVAETLQAAVEGRKRVRVVYEPLPVVTDPVAAMAADAPLVHEAKGTNLLKHIPVRKGDVQAGLAVADVIVEGTYRTPFQEHAYLQPEAGLGYIDGEGRVTLVCASQWPHDDLRQISHALDLPENRLREIVPAVGGAFGGREDISLQILVCLAAWRLQRPVKMVWTREESIRGHGKRHPFVMRHRWGATRDGKLTAVEVEAILDAGAYASTSVPVLSNAVSFMAGPYYVPHVRIDGSVVHTNNAVTMAMRGFGATQPPVGYELQMDKLAAALGMDPVELRMRNLLRPGWEAATGNSMPAITAARETLRAAAVAAGWRETASGWERPPRASAPGKHLRRGIGVACAYKNVGYSFGFPDRSRAVVDLVLGADGDIERAIVHCSAVEVGQGVMTVLAQMAAETLGIALERVRVALVDTADTPDAGSSSASRHTFMSGNAVVRACRAALAERARAREEGTDLRRVSGEATIEGLSLRRTTAYDPITGLCEPHISYSFGTQIAVVDVDGETGAVTVARLLAANNAGRPVNPQMCFGQVAGGMAMGLGMALMEEFIQRDGRIRTAHFSEYKIPTYADMPCEFESVLTDVQEPNGPYGATGLGEIPTLPTTPAILNAIHDATGVWVEEAPATPERVWRALRGMTQGAEA